MRFQYRAKVGGRGRTSRLKKKKQKYLDFWVEISIIYGEIMQRPWHQWSPDKQALAKKHRKILFAAMGIRK